MLHIWLVEALVQPVVLLHCMGNSYNRIQPLAFQVAQLVQEVLANQAPQELRAPPALRSTQESLRRQASLHHMVGRLFALDPFPLASSLHHHWSRLPSPVQMI